MNSDLNVVWKIAVQRLIIILRVSKMSKVLFLDEPSLFKMCLSLSCSTEHFLLTLSEWNLIYVSRLCAFTTQPLSVKYCNIWQLQFFIKPSHIHIFHSLWRLYVFIWQTRKLVLVLPQQDSSPHFFPLQL